MPMARIVRYAIAVLVLVTMVVGHGMAADKTTFRSAPPQDHEEISAYLSKPAGEGPFPAVILLHGCTGLERDGYAMPWRGLSDHARFLNDNGFVTLIVDSHGSRGITASEAWTASCRLGKGFFERTSDVFGALDYLEGLPFVARGQVGLVGLSQGGSVIFNVLRKRRAQGRIAAGIAFYPDCRYFGVPNAFYVPILVLIGAADDITRAQACRALVERVGNTAKKGSIAPDIVVYPDVHHSFDLPLGQRFTTPIGTVAPDPAATRDARQRMLGFLREHITQ